MKCLLISFLLAASITAFAQSNKDVSLSNNQIRLSWHQTASGWKIKTLAVRTERGWRSIDNPSGEHILLYSKEKPSDKPDSVFKTIAGVNFPEPNYKYQLEQWKETTNPVALNSAGKAYYFLPANRQAF